MVISAWNKVISNNGKSTKSKQFYKILAGYDS